MKFSRDLLHEKTGMKINQPSSEGGTTSAYNIARVCFMNKNNFIKWILTLIASEFRDTNTSAILRVFNSSRQIDTTKLSTLGKYTYEFIVTELQWVNITPSLHKLFVHCVKLIETFNNGYGMRE